MLSRLKIGMLASVAIMLAIGISGVAAVSAQDASPTAVDCVSPGLPPGTPTPMEEDMEGMASPEAVGSPEAGASPEAMEMGTPEPLPAGTAAEGDQAAEIEAAAANYVACLAQGWATGDPTLFVALESARFILDDTGTGNPYDRVANEMGSPFTDLEVLAISDPQVYDDGRVGANIHAVVNGTWLVNLQAIFVQEKGSWLLDQQAFQSPDTSFADGVSVVGIDIVETTDESTGAVTYAFQFLGSTTVPQNEVIALNVSNKGAEAHEVIVVQLPEGADPMGLLDESIPFDQINFLAFVAPVFPGESVDIGLLNLEPGVYTLVCFFPGPDGLPHAANGMIAQFEVVAPAA